tara:strand:+ start:656 stop:913 length:258 start_codon:yes stop_codon:yes gene_type:complete
MNFTNTNSSDLTDFTNSTDLINFTNTNLTDSTTIPNMIFTVSNLIKLICYPTLIFSGSVIGSVIYDYLTFKDDNKDDDDDDKKDN